MTTRVCTWGPAGNISSLPIGMVLMRAVVALIAALFISLPGFGGEGERPYLITLYGSRGSGRTLVNVRLRQDYALPNISLAPLLTNHLLEETTLGKKAHEFEKNGGEFPQELCLSIIYDRLEQPDASHGVLLEEFPSSVEQAKLLHEKLKSKFNFLAIMIETTDDWLIQRVQNRFICRMCGRVYDTPSPPTQKGVCDICSGPLEQRLEDSADLIRSRLDAYITKVTPVLEYYKAANILATVRGERKLEDVYQEVLSIVESKTKLMGQKTKHSKRNKLFSQEGT